MQVNELKAFNDVLNQLVSDYRTPIDEKIGKENMISIKLFQLYISFQELKEKRDAKKDSLRNIIPKKIFLEFSHEGYVGLNVNRADIFSSAIELIKSNPIFGIGASSFSEIFKDLVILFPTFFSL